MHRRNFIHTLAGGGASLALLKLPTTDRGPKENASVNWTVQGFTCVTCAVGLQTVLEKHTGIARVRAEYLSGKVEIGFDSHAVTLAEIKRLVEQAGFKVKEEAHGS